MVITTLADGFLFTGTVNGRVINEFVSRKDADNRTEAIAIRIDRVGC